MTTYEVEQKFPVADMAALEARLVALGATVSGPQSQIDHYYAHPARDFASTDEALRVRRTDRASYLTYKGPKVDATTKTRREIELPLGPHERDAPSAGALIASLAQQLGLSGSQRKSYLELLLEGRSL